MKKIKESVNVKIIYHFYHHVVKAELKKRDFPKDVVRKIDEEHHKIIQRAKDIGNSRLLSSYIMGSYFIAMNRSTGKSAEEKRTLEIFKKCRYSHLQKALYECFRKGRKPSGKKRKTSFCYLV